MKKKNIYGVLFIFIGIILLGIGYASIHNINLVVNGFGSAVATQNNFRVEFTDASIEPDTNDVSINQDKISATFDVTSLSKKGDIAVATYTIKNFSNGIGANIKLKLNNSNNEYFKVTEYIADSILNAGEETTATITIEMIKTSIDYIVSTSVVAELIAEPIDSSDFSSSNMDIPHALSDPDTIMYGINVNHANGSYVLSNTDGLYDSYAQAALMIPQEAFIEYHITDNVVSYSNLVFNLGGIVTTLQSGSENIINNINTIDGLFGQGNCYHDDYNERYICTNNESGIFRVMVYDNGNLSADAGGSSWVCNITSDPIGFCYN